MSSFTMYLLPEDRTVAPKRYFTAVKEALLRMGVIDDVRYADKEGWYCPGEASPGIFVDPSELQLRFRYCEIAASPHRMLIPQDAAMASPRCPSCSADVAEVYRDLIRTIARTADPAARARQYRGARLICPACGRPHSLEALRDDTGIFLSRLWVRLEEAPSSLRPEWLAEFESATGIRHRCLEYGRT